MNPTRPRGDFADSRSARPLGTPPDQPRESVRTGLVFALSLSLSGVVLACRSSEREQPVAAAEPHAQKQDVGTKPPPAPFSVHPVATPKREITIRIEDIKEIEVIDLEVSEPPDFTQGKVGRPRELLRAKHLRLSASSPLAKNRGLVLVTEGPGSRAKTLEAVLVDFKTGEVARFADAHGPIAGMDAAFGKQLVADGLLQSVLIHADGLSVPWVPEGRYQALLDVVINPWAQRDLSSRPQHRVGRQRPRHRVLKMDRSAKATTAAHIRTPVSAARCSPLAHVVLWSVQRRPPGRSQTKRDCQCPRRQAG